MNVPQYSLSFIQMQFEMHVKLLNIFFVEIISKTIDKSFL